MLLLQLLMLSFCDVLVVKWRVLEMGVNSTIHHSCHFREVYEGMLNILYDQIQIILYFQRCKCSCKGVITDIGWINKSCNELYMKRFIWGNWSLPEIQHILVFHRQYCTLTISNFVNLYSYSTVIVSSKHFPNSSFGFFSPEPIYVPAKKTRLIIS